MIQITDISNMKNSMTLSLFKYILEIPVYNVNFRTHLNVKYCLL